MGPDDSSENVGLLLFFFHGNKLTTSVDATNDVKFLALIFFPRPKWSTNFFVLHKLSRSFFAAELAPVRLVLFGGEISQSRIFIAHRSLHVYGGSHHQDGSHDILGICITAVTHHTSPPLQPGEIHDAEVISARSQPCSS